MSSLTRQDPFRSMLSWPRWLEDFELDSQRGLRIRETDKSLIAEAVVAGVPGKDVEIHIEDGVLTIKAEANEESKKGDDERSVTYKYYYTAALAGGQWDKAEAEVENGVVTVTVPKLEAARPQKIAVREKKAA